MPPLDSDSADRGRSAEGHRGDLVRDAIEEAADSIEASARDAGR